MFFSSSCEVNIYCNEVYNTQFVKAHFGFTWFHQIISLILKWFIYLELIPERCHLIVRNIITNQRTVSMCPMHCRTSPGSSQTTVCYLLLWWCESWKSAAITLEWRYHTDKYKYRPHHLCRFLTRVDFQVNKNEKRHMLLRPLCITSLIIINDFGTNNNVIKNYQAHSLIFFLINTIVNSYMYLLETAWA